MHASRSLPRLLAIAGAAILASACTMQPKVPVEVAAAPTALDAKAPAAIVFADLERRLLDAPTLRMRYAVTSEGAFNASLNGTLELTQRTGVDLQAAGVFGNAPAALHLRSDGEIMEGGSAQRTFRDPTAPALREALTFGLTRMGILHNLARLTGGAAPDHAAGGVSEWVEVRGVEYAADTAGANPNWLGLRLPIYVSGTHTAEATLWLDRRTGLPVRREQVVTFPNGTMRVVEQYEFGR